MRLFGKKKLTDIYQKYNSKRVTYGINIFDSIPDGKRHTKLKFWNYSKRQFGILIQKN